MRAGKKWIWVVLTAVLVLGAITTAWAMSRSGPPQIITLPDGERFRFAGVSYGTNHVPPSILAHLIHGLPGPLAMLARKCAIDRISQFNEVVKFDSPQLFVWFEHLGTNVRVVPPPSAVSSSGVVLERIQTLSQVILVPKAILADDDGVPAGNEPSAHLANTSTWTYLAFSTVPRRSPTLTCCLDLVGDDEHYTNVTFANPLHDRYPQWRSEALPTVKTANGLEVRLDQVKCPRARTRDRHHHIQRHRAFA